jgi:hypothetical protein
VAEFAEGYPCEGGDPRAVEQDPLEISAIVNPSVKGNGVGVDHGPGYRVYFGQVDQRIVLLLCGGDKSSQGRDIDKARAYWEDYRRREDGDE